MGEIVRQHFDYSSAESLAQQIFWNLKCLRSFRRCIYHLGTVGPIVGAKDSGNDGGGSNVILAVNTVWYMWHYRSRLRACPRGTQQTDLSEIQTTLGMLCNLFLILRLRSQPPPPMSSSNSTCMFLRHWFFCSCDWIKLWFLFNLIGA